MRKTTIQLAGLLAVTILFYGAAQAQTVDQVAAEVDAVEVTVDQVDVKASKNRADLDALKGGLPAVESRVTALEALPTVDPTVAARLSTVEADHAQAIPRLATVETQVTNNDARILSLETSPGGVSQADVDALAARLAALEANPVKKWVARDSQGTYVSSFFDRGAIGLTFIEVLPGVEIRVNINPESIYWYGIIPSGGAKFYAAGCNGEPYVKPQAYHPADLSSGDFFGGMVEGEVVTRADGSQYVVKVDPSTIVPTGDLFVIRYDPVSGARKCEFAFRGADMYRASMYLYELPTFIPPLTIGLE